jgi:hypothetical protein
MIVASRLVLLGAHAQGKAGDPRDSEPDREADAKLVGPEKKGRRARAATTQVAFRTSLC